MIAWCMPYKPQNCAGIVATQDTDVPLRFATALLAMQIT